MAFVQRFLDNLDEINRPIRVFYATSAFTFVLMLSTMLRNLSAFSDPLFEVQPDLTFYLQVINIVVGSAVVFRLLKFHKEIGSIDFLLVAIFIIQSGVMLSIWIIWEGYISPAGGYLAISRADLASQYNWPEVIVARIMVLGSYLMIVIHAVRMRGWANFAKWQQAFIAFVGINYTVFTLTDFILQSRLPMISSPEQWAYEVSQWYANLDFFGILTIIGVPSIHRHFLNYMLVFFLALYCYLTVKPVISSREITLSRVAWIIFALSQFTLYTYIYIGFAIQGSESYYSNFALWSLFSSISYILFLVVLYWAPEAFLISKLQFYRAKKLYRFIDAEESSSSLSLFDYQQRIHQYIENLPPELKSQIKNPETTQ